MEPAEVIESISRDGVRWVRLQFLDIDGKLREVSVHSSKILSSVFEEGIRIPEISDFFLGEEENLYLKPLPSTYSLIPWEDGGARMLCSILKNGKPYERDSINILEKVNGKYALSGYTAVMVQPVQEFSLFETVVVDKTSPERGPSVNLDSREGVWNSNPLAFDNKWKAVSMPQDVYSLIRVQIVDTLLSFFGIAIKSNSHGKAMSKQVFSFEELNLMDAASSIISSKYVARNVSILNGALATFMPYPMYMNEPNRLSFRIKIKKRTKNIFYDGEDKNSLSKEAKLFMTGIIKHAPSMTLFTNPTTNSYKAIVTFPLHNAWSSKLGNTIISVLPSSNSNETYIEVKISDSSANPYLALSSILLAGLEGLKGNEVMDELEEDPSLLSEKQKANKLGASLPFSLYDSIISFEKDTSYLKGVFSPQFISDYISLKLNEYKEDISRPSGYDYMNYFNI